jgi:hypothetical protein
MTEAKCGVGVRKGKNKSFGMEMVYFRRSEVTRKDRTWHDKITGRRMDAEEM